jgi:hypothetical protein
MGTRGMWGYVIEGEEKFAYNHFDSYPSCLGAELLEHVRGADLDDLREKSRALQLVTDETPPTLEQQERMVALGAYDGAVSTGRPTEWYSLLRNTQGDPELTLKAGLMEDGHEFAIDSLFCEWAYVIDLDAGQFEVYEGFQKSAHDRGRFADRADPGLLNGSADGRTYYPVALVAQWPLDALPSADEFQAKLEPQEV